MNENKKGMNEFFGIPIVNDNLFEDMIQEIKMMKLNFRVFCQIFSVNAKLFGKF